MWLTEMSINAKPKYIININTVEPANNGHPRDRSKWPLCTGDRYRQVGYNMGSLEGTY